MDMGWLAGWGHRAHAQMHRASLRQNAEGEARYQASSGKVGGSFVGGEGLSARGAAAGNERIVGVWKKQPRTRQGTGKTEGQGWHREQVLGKAKCVAKKGQGEKTKGRNGSHPLVVMPRKGRENNKSGRGGA